MKFATSPLMSTYLVAFIVSDFKSINATTSRGASLLRRSRWLHLRALAALIVAWVRRHALPRLDAAGQDLAGRRGPRIGALPSTTGSNWECHTERLIWMFCLDVQAVKILTYYEDLYQLPFPLPKQDLVAVPDFSVLAVCPSCRFTRRVSVLVADVAFCGAALAGGASLL